MSIQDRRADMDQTSRLSGSDHVRYVGSGQDDLALTASLRMSDLPTRTARFSGHNKGGTGKTRRSVVLVDDLFSGLA